MLRLGKSHSNRELLCHQYWQRQYTKYHQRPQAQNLTANNIQINSVNAVLTGINKRIKDTDKALIQTIDTEFKFRIKPIKKDKVLYRGVSPKSVMYKYEGKEACDNRFAQSLKVKKGQIIHMPEYAFATDSEEYAKNFAQDGIIYEIFAEKGSKIAYNDFMFEWNFPRASSFECIDVIDNPTPEIQKKIRLKYIKPPKESLLGQLQAKCKYFCSNIFCKN